ncbi:DEAD/DEAH box helicase [Ferrimonas marina]|uniref:Superfamily II DNA and RNA helicase n=1 Tax=Ferrimonas marina TaxID=299255 RepID=A0A1M5VLY4_9GAMM|nr:DEAD/DEAH box helicase [Ferrimonas marina]SHH76064.1 Superfamily II DNA and RNA helicase [Ferrimonas marina]
MSFASQGFGPEIVRAVSECGYDKMTPVQRKAIPAARKGRDILANAQTGTGKTAAFALPIIQQLLDTPTQRQGRQVRALILAPTRELAAQIANNCRDYTQYTELSVAVVYGGTKMAGQAATLQKGVDILVATPGRLLEHVAENNVSLTQVHHLVLDEADRMLDMGFSGELTRVMKLVPPKHQTMLFSATYPPKMKQLATQSLKNPVVVAVAPQNSTAETVSHVIYPVDQDRKLDLIVELVGRKNWRQVLVFANYKETVDAVVSELNQYGVPAEACHGDKGQGARRRALREFKEGKIRVLVATDVAARGLDIQGLPYVVNFDVPFLAEDYVHRIGRTGRAGAQGHAISFVARDEELSIAQIEQLIQQRIRRINQPGYEVKDRTNLIYEVHNKQRYTRKRARENNPTDQSAGERQLRGRRTTKRR